MNKSTHSLSFYVYCTLTHTHTHTYHRVYANIYNMTEHRIIPTQTQVYKKGYTYLHDCQLHDGSFYCCNNRFIAVIKYEYVMLIIHLLLLFSCVSKADAKPHP